ncbi:hypothetical protein [Pedobacter nototheniae]|uniref:hypothetical protein n=1 Tax=Pedobacter nototheniae TaxID=2488994 RepID=UPI00103E3E02|nr:hypothetical protein [Pedobacter nototheniae]
MKGIKLLLVLMIISSLFMGIKIKQWGFLFGFEFYEFPVKMLKHESIKNILAWGVLVFSHTIIFILPFITNKTYFNKALVLAPIIFICAFCILNIGFLILLFPFIIVWIIAVVKYKKI